ncbi:FAD-dependent oxidoreductase [Ascoidea rubescens DSM 1968]|uniref:Nucleotide-binding domain-containing protein n=1 Tax=Ascoidea rubescens DSM 1968 TaxID=1344418 RepID=A0A1D2VFD5_9ASCO|nr:nucleotide-binding domain-containing protein [Ascoidea rubescens DSM 1968]ODV60384.1 nucleotide-binding domain-containing protein [Ascoidea rubescens DSM 1968]
MSKIVVIGAGVAGLTTAYLLAQKGHDVTIVARNIPGDLDPHYTSPWAGANWSSFAQKDEIVLQNFDKPAYHEFLRLAKNEPLAGIRTIYSYHYIKKENAKDYESRWFKDFVEGYEVFTDPKLLPDDCSIGYKFKTVTISTSLYLFYLLKRCVDLNAVYRRKKLDHINQAFDLHSSGSKADYVFNCTGLLAKTLGGVNDESIYPVRGQVLLVNNTGTKQVVASLFPEYSNESLYTMPRKEGGTILGGCFIKDVWDTTPDNALTQRIIERAKKYQPELIDPNVNNNPTDIEIIRVNVGLRPFRKNGPRVEIDSVNPKIIHNYGAGGAGYQSSYGMAGAAIELLEASIPKSKL